jgi:hypothetical protein
LASQNKAKPVQTIKELAFNFVSFQLNGNMKTPVESARTTQGRRSKTEPEKKVENQKAIIELYALTGKYGRNENCLLGMMMRVAGSFNFRLKKIVFVGFEANAM